jgi:integrase
MERFVAFKRMQGYDYTVQSRMLILFDRFLLLDEDCSDGLLRTAQFSAYLATTARLSGSTREGRLSAVREFSRYLHALHPASAVVPPGMLPRHQRRIRFRRLEPEEILRLMDAASRLRPRQSIRPHCIRFLIGLLYSTGLRIAEALKLNLGDVDLDRSTLFVRRGKFGKDRLVAMSASLHEALRAWLQLRSHHATTGPSAPLLVGTWNSRLTCWQARYAFRVLCRRCGLLGQPSPRLHDLRHNFACRCLARWREQGKDVQALLPVLANAMGHVNFFATQLYIHVEAETLRHASAKLSTYIAQQRRLRR